LHLLRRLSCTSVHFVRAAPLFYLALTLYELSHWRRYAERCRRCACCAACESKLCSTGPRVRCCCCCPAGASPHFRSICISCSTLVFPFSFYELSYRRRCAVRGPRCAFAVCQCKLSPAGARARVADLLVRQSLLSRCCRSMHARSAAGASPCSHARRARCNAVLRCLYNPNFTPAFL